MSNHQLKIGLVAAVLSTIMIFAVSLPAANALTTRDMSVFNDQHHTDRFPGGQKICGDHLCSTAEWTDMKVALSHAQYAKNHCDELKSWKACGEPTTVVKQKNQ